MSTYSIIRDMSVGDEVIVPFAKWGAARSAASVLKRIFGAVYHVGVNREKEIVTIVREA